MNYDIIFDELIRYKDIKFYKNRSGKIELIGIKHCGNGNDALFGSFDNWTQCFNEFKRSNKGNDIYKEHIEFFEKFMR